MEHLQERNVSSETTVDIEYVERTPAPEPQDSILHDDWVSSVKTLDKWILTGCYDSSVNIWTTHGKIVASSKEHKNVVKCVSWLDQNDPSKGFVSVSHDLVGIIWSWEPGTVDVVPKVALRGHERGIDSVGVSPNAAKIATGGWDTNLKIWQASLEDETGEPAHKKSKGGRDLLIRTPLNTLKGHKEAISSINWVDNYVVSTASMDHTIKLWDVEVNTSISFFEIYLLLIFFSVVWHQKRNNWSKSLFKRLLVTSNKHVTCKFSRQTHKTL